MCGRAVQNTVCPRAADTIEASRADGREPEQRCSPASTSPAPHRTLLLLLHCSPAATPTLDLSCLLSSDRHPICPHPTQQLFPPLTSGELFPASWKPSSGAEASGAPAWSWWRR